MPLGHPSVYFDQLLLFLQSGYCKCLPILRLSLESWSHSPRWNDFPWGPSTLIPRHVRKRGASLPCLWFPCPLPPPLGFHPASYPFLGILQSLRIHAPSAWNQVCPIFLKQDLLDLLSPLSWLFSSPHSPCPWICGLYSVVTLHTAAEWLLPYHRLCPWLGRSASLLSLYFTFTFLHLFSIWHKLLIRKERTVVVVFFFLALSRGPAEFYSIPCILYGGSVTHKGTKIGPYREKIAYN